MKYDVDQKVKLRKNGKLGIVLQCKHERIKTKEGNKDVIKDVKRYLVNFGSYFAEWYDEIELAHQYEFTSYYDKTFLNFIIDICLTDKKLHHLIPNFNKQRNEIK